MVSGHIYPKGYTIMAFSCGHCNGKHQTIPQVKECSKTGSTKKFTNKGPVGPDRNKLVPNGISCAACGLKHESLQDVMDCSAENPGTFKGRQFRLVNETKKSTNVGDKVLYKTKSYKVTEMSDEGVTIKVGRNKIVVDWKTVVHHRDMVDAK